MNPVESIKHFFVLLFWYIGERNWTVQSTSSIVKPRKEPEDYQPGDKVAAKFQGKLYKAVIVRIEDDKEALAEDKVRFDKLLHDASLSPNQILEQMGVTADLDTENGDNEDKPKTVQTKKTKIPVEKQPKSSTTKTKTGKSDSQIDSIKMLEKQKKKASLESSKLMAARLLKGSKTDKEFQPSNSSSKNMTTVTSTPSNFSFASTPSLFQHTSVCSSPSHPQMSMQNYMISSPLGSIASSCQVSAPSSTSSSSSSCIPHYQTLQTPETFTDSNTGFQQNMLQSTHSLNQVAFPLDNTFQHPGRLYDWEYSGSASESIANSLDSADNREFTPFLDCSRCMPLIHALTQRIITLEGKVETLIAANKHTNKHLSSHTTSPITFGAQTTTCTMPSPSYTKDSTSEIASASPQSLQSATPIQSSSSVSDQISITPTCSDERDRLSSVELLPGYGVKITMPQLDACLRKSKGSGTALARLLVNVYFDDETLAHSSVRGTKSKPALDSKIINAIINYVCSTRQKCSERDIVQALNQKCADARVTLDSSCKRN